MTNCKKGCYSNARPVISKMCTLVRANFRLINQTMTAIIIMGTTLFHSFNSFMHNITDVADATLNNYLVKMSLSTNRRLCSNMQHHPRSTTLDIFTCTGPFCHQHSAYWGEFHLNKAGTRPEIHFFPFHLWRVQLFHKCAGLVTFNADRGHHFTGDHTQQLDQEQCGQLELG